MRTSAPCVGAELATLVDVCRRMTVAAPLKQGVNVVTQLDQHTTHLKPLEGPAFATLVWSADEPIACPTVIEFCLQQYITLDDAGMISVGSPSRGQGNAVLGAPACILILRTDIDAQLCFLVAQQKYLRLPQHITRPEVPDDCVSQCDATITYTNFEDELTVGSVQVGRVAGIHTNY